MECNKDEAVRAKEIAETKMMKNDFEGAKRIATKARELYPDLENITQLLSICDVHCAARQPLVGSDKDWYGILQVDKFADELVVKKQYRRLALFLHPDKNRFPGAEAAFKLICEANAVLSDPPKKSLYDNKIRVANRSASLVPPHHANKNSQFSQQYGGHVKVSNLYSTLNQQAKQTNLPVKPDMFWTSCPFCSFRYQFDRKSKGLTFTCQKCLKRFTAHEICPQGPQVFPVKPSVSQPYGFQGKGFETQGTFKTGIPNGMGHFASHVGLQQGANRQTVQPNVQTESIFKGKQAGKAEKVSEVGKEGTTSNGHANNRKTGNRNIKRKRAGKFAVESSESADTSSESDPEDVTIEKKSDAAKDLNSGPSQFFPTRRSSRNRQNISYIEDDDDELLCFLKKSQGSKLPEVNGKGEKDTLDGVSGKHDLPADTDHSKPESKEPNEKAGGMPDTADEIDESDSDMGNLQFEDPEFYDFEKDRDVTHFAVDQFWACYDEIDGMPRYYAMIKKVRVSPFELSIKWLEADPIEKEQKKWVDNGLPASCGRFKLGQNDKSSRQMFSMQVHFAKGIKGSLIMLPRAGEIWAIFKDWDSSWSSMPKDRVYKYEVVQVESDFDYHTGSRVIYLDKVEGFVSIFKKCSPINAFRVRGDALYRFSHRIPFHKMTGTEREGVPEGSFELDPASLPLNSDDLYYPGKQKI